MLRLSREHRRGSKGRDGRGMRTTHTDVAIKALTGVRTAALQPEEGFVCFSYEKELLRLGQMHIRLGKKKEKNEIKIIRILLLNHSGKC